VAAVMGANELKILDFAKKKPPADRGLKFREETSKKGNK
jgi:hypothetical protein